MREGGGGVVDLRSGGVAIGEGCGRAEKLGGVGDMKLFSGGG